MMQEKVYGRHGHAAGQPVQWPGGTVTISAEYDVEGRLSRVLYNDVEQEKYFYNARNQRVKNRYSPLRVYGLGGELLGEYVRVEGHQADREWLERVYFAGACVGEVDSYGGWRLPNTVDRLGSLKQGSRRYPFGDGNESYAYDEYATYRRDHASAHYYAWNRYYSATWGRFSSPDPYVMSGGLTNPQGWNRYSYVANDPVNFHDPAGLFRRVPTGSPITYLALPQPSPDILIDFGPGFGSGDHWGMGIVHSELDSPGGGGNSNSYNPLYPECNDGRSEEEDKRLAFLASGYSAAQRLSTSTAVPAEWILAWAAVEAGWGYHQPDKNIAIHNSNFYGLRAGANWLNQSACPQGAIAGWACFASFEDSTVASLLSLRREPKTGTLWTAAGLLADEFIKGISISIAFQKLADWGHDPGNSVYGQAIGKVNVSGRLDCLRKAGYVQ
jgi:RHS repeat-associated protein